MAKREFYKHPDYERLKDKWKFYLLSYEGGDEYKDEDKEKYLYRHPREIKEDYDYRHERAVFESISQVVVNVWASHIRRKGIERRNQNKEFENFIQNCDKENHELDYFLLERVFPVTQTCGFSYVLCDLPQAQIEPKTEYDRKTNGLNPYLVHYYPTDVVNWKWTNGKFDWILFEESRFVGDDDPIEMSKQQDLQTYYKLWTPTDWSIYNKFRKFEAGGEHDFGEIPVSIFYNKESLIYNLPIGLSALKIIAEIDRKIYNLNSLLDEFLYRQCFAQLVLDKDTLGKIIETGTTRALTVDEDATKPYFLQPPTGGAEFIVKERDRLIDSSYQFAMVRGDNYVKEKQDQSGVAKAYDLHDSNQNIAQKARNMETAEQNIHRLLDRFHGKIEVEYPNNFDIKTLNEELKEMLDVFKADIGSITYSREKAKNLVKRDLEKADPELMKKIYDELDKANPALDFEQRMEGARMGVFSIADLIRQENPQVSDKEVEKKVNEILEIKKKFENQKEEKPEPTLAELTVE